MGIIVYYSIKVAHLFKNVKKSWHYFIVVRLVDSLSQYSAIMLHVVHICQEFRQLALVSGVRTHPLTMIHGMNRLDLTYDGNFSNDENGLYQRFLS